MKNVFASAITHQRTYVFEVCIFTLFISDYIQQGQDLTEKPHILISTPGRLADLLENTDTFKINKIKYLVSIKVLILMA